MNPNIALVTGINVDVHVPQLDVASDRCPRLTANPAKVISVGTARRFNLTNRGHAALCLPNKSFWPPHSHVASVKMVAIDRGSPYLHTTTRELQTCTFDGPGASNTTKIPREDLQRKTKRAKMGRERGKNAKFWALRGSTLRAHQGSTLRGLAPFLAYSETVKRKM